MGRIRILDEAVASKIAAGEVVDRPSSAVKELMENSVDAGASSVTVVIAEGGRRLIKVSDDGEGISREDAPLCFARSGTSKISTEDDLERISTLGFRGEALYSIASVSRVLLKTRRREDLAGTSVAIEGGGAPVVSDEGCPAGTAIEVRDLFYNTPARLKFLKSNETEFGHILDVFKRLALVNPGIRFRLVNGSSPVVEAPPGALRQRIIDLFGKELDGGLMELTSPFVRGYIGGHELSYSTPRCLFTYVNGRAVRDRMVNRAVLDGYSTLIPGSRYPFAVINITIPPEDVDVNIHPAKSEVRFRNQRAVYEAVRTTIKVALSRGTMAPEAHLTTKAPHIQPVTGMAGVSAPSLNEAPSEYVAESQVRTVLPFSGRRTGINEAAPAVKNPQFLKLHYVGQLWGEFLIAESRDNGGEFYLIDQHGAAERCAFEGLKRRYYGGASIPRQMLLLPERLEVAPDEAESIRGASEKLERLGFDIAHFGPSVKTAGETFIVKAVPDVLSRGAVAPVIKDIAGELSSAGGSATAEERIEEVLMKIACHSVIRGPKALTPEEARALLTGLSKVDFASYCPHGRPAVKKYARSEIEAIFKR